MPASLGSVSFLQDVNDDIKKAFCENFEIECRGAEIYPLASVLFGIPPKPDPNTCGSTGMPEPSRA